MLNPDVMKARIKVCESLNNASQKVEFLQLVEKDDKPSPISIPIVGFGVLGLGLVAIMSVAWVIDKISKKHRW